MSSLQTGPGFAVVSRAKQDGARCGDLAAVLAEGSGGDSLLCIADGAGHGEPALEAARAALDHVEASRGLPLETIVLGCDAAIRRTRGVALGLARVCLREARVRYVAVGNTRALVASGDQSTLLPSTPGIVGAGVRAVRAEEVALACGDVIVLATDGLLETLSLSSYPRALREAPADLARRLFEDFATDRDDATVLVYRVEAAA